MTKARPRAGYTDGIIRLPVTTRDGDRTCVSIPEPMFARFVAASGSRKEFNRHMADAVAVVVPRPGYTRSLGVRIELERSLPLASKRTHA